MHVEPFERGTFKVSSRSGEEPYTVDLGSGNGNSKCDCMDFRNRCRPEVSRQKEAGQYKRSDYTICAHIRAAEKFIKEKLYASYIESIRSAGDYRDDEEF